MNVQVRILATVVVAISPLSTVSLHAQRMASLFDMAADGTAQSSASSSPAPSVREPAAHPGSLSFLVTPTFAPCPSWPTEIALSI